MDLLFPESCVDCTHRQPVKGVCTCNYRQVLENYFERNPNTTCPFREQQFPADGFEQEN